MNHKKLTCILALLLLISCGHSNLQKEGIPTSGTVLSKKTVSTKHSFRYILEVSYFTQPDKENLSPEKKDTSKTPPPADDLIDDTGKAHVHAGKYTSTEIYVNSAEFERYKEGDPIELVYDKKIPERAEVKVLK